MPASPPPNKLKRPRPHPSGPSKLRRSPPPPANPPPVARPPASPPSDQRSAAQPKVALVQKLRRNPQVAYVIAQIKKSLHHSGTVGVLNLQDEQAIYDEVEQMLLNSPSVLHEIQRMQQG